MIELHPTTTDSDASECSAPGTPSSLRGSHSCRASRRSAIPEVPGYDEGSHGQADDDNVPKRTALAPTSLPCCVRPFVQFLIYDAILEVDDLDAVLRKATTSVAAVLSILSLGFGAVTMLRLGPSSGSIGLLCCGVMQLYAVGLYVHMRRTRQLAAGGLIGYFAIAILTLAFSTVSRPTGGFSNYCEVTVAAIILCKLHWRVLWCAVLTAIVAVTSYNEAVLLDAIDEARLDSGPPLLAIPGYLRETLATVVVERVIAFLGAVVLIVGIRCVLDAHVKQSRAARHSANIAADVAAELAMFETRTAARLLKRASNVAAKPAEGSAAAPTTTEPPAEADDAPAPGDADRYRNADARLIDILRTMVDSFDAFRPHLPNWVLGQSKVSSAKAKASDSQITLSKSDSSPCAAYRVKSDRRKADGSQPRVAIRVPTAAEAGHIADAGNHKVSSQRSFRVATSTPMTTSHSLPPAKSGEHKKRRSGSAIPPMPRLRAERRAFAEATVNITVSCEQLAPRDLGTIGNAVVDAVHLAASENDGAVMFIAGDRATVTWNTARAVDVPGVCAGLFLADMKQHVLGTVAPRAALLARAGPPTSRPGASSSSDSSGAGLPAAVQVSAAAVSGQGFVHLAGKHATQRALLLHGEHRQLLTKLAEAAGVHHAFLADSGCVEAANASLRARGVLAFTIPVDKPQNPPQQADANASSSAAATTTTVAVGNGLVATLPASAVFMDTVPTRSRVAKVFEVVGRAGFGAPIPSPGASLLTAPNDMGSKDSADAEQTPMTVAAGGTPHSDQDGDHQGHEWNRAAFASDHHLVSRTMGATNPMIHDAIVTNALQLCLLGNYADAVAELDALPPGYANGASLVQGLMTRARLFAKRHCPSPRAAAETTPDSDEPFATQLGDRCTN